MNIRVILKGYTLNIIVILKEYTLTFSDEIS